MINVTSATCTGCRACEFLCPVGCIELVPDDEGFLVARADASSCIECGLCERRCPQNSNDRLLHNPNVAYAAKLDNYNPVLLESASGGAFPALVQPVLERGGVVYGAAFNNNLRVTHERIDSKQELWRLQGSKYVQCDTATSYKQVFADLHSGLQVVFSGTPCQVAGLKAYLGKDYHNLFTIDLVCHGVASPLMFAHYVAWLNQRYGKVERYRFRSKRYGWGLVVEIIANGRSITASSTDPYNKLYLWGVTFRECCYQCPYAQIQRCGDVTLCDGWGIQRIRPEFYQKNGVSGMLVNTDKGSLLLRYASNRLLTTPLEVRELAAHCGNLNAPSKRPPLRDAIYHGIGELDAVEFVNRKMLPFVTWKDRAKALVPFWVKYPLKRLFRKF